MSIGITPVLNFFSSLISPVTEYVKGSQEMKKAVVVAKIKRVAAGEMSDIDMDRESRQIAGWMDDVSFYGTYLLFALAFYPASQPHVQAGFAIIENMPIFMQVMMGLMLVRVWGFSRLLGPIISMIVKSSVLGRKT